MGRAGIRRIDSMRELNPPGPPSRMISDHAAAGAREGSAATIRPFLSCVLTLALVASSQAADLTVWSGDRPQGKTWAKLGPKGKLEAADGAGHGTNPRGLLLHLDGSGYRGCGLNWKGWYPPDAADDVTRYTALTFAVGAAYAGVAGALAALLLDFIAPESFTYWLSILFLVGSVFGGMTSVWGVVAGGLFLQFWPDIAGMVSRDLVYPVFGALLVLSMRYMPNGVVAGAVSVWRWLATRTTRARL